MSTKKKGKDFSILSVRHRRRLIAQEVKAKFFKSNVVNSSQLETNKSDDIQPMSHEVDMSNPNKSICSDMEKVNCSVTSSASSADLPLVSISHSKIDDNNQEIDDNNQEIVDLPFTQNNNIDECNSEIVHKVPKTSLNEDLVECFQKHNVSHAFINDLLGVLNNHGVQSLPKDVRSLMHTPRSKSFNILKIAGGNYIHFGIETNIVQFIKKYCWQNSVLILNINIDGLPLSKSSASQFWPILGDIDDDNTYRDPFIIGLFHGLKKPEDPNEFLNSFIEEYKTLEANGITVEGKTFFVKLGVILCDAPAKSFVTMTKNHTGYFSCSKCMVEGDYIENRVVFLENSVLRNDESFRNRQNPEHHRGTSILESLNIDMVRQIPLDCMHLIFLGVVKKMLSLWIKGNIQYRLNKTKIEEFDMTYKSLAKYIPEEFARKPRSILELEYWKATEFRLFLLYLGPIVMKNILSQSASHHFLSFAVSLRLLYENIRPDSIDYAASLLAYFVSKFGYFFGVQNIVYNVHNLTHFADEVRIHRSVNRISAFKFENYMYKIKQKVKHSRYPLQQVANRVAEENSKENCLREKNYPEIVLRDGRIVKVIFSTFSLSLMKSCENVCLLPDRFIVIIEEFFTNEGELYFTGKYYKKTEPFFKKPCDSTSVGIFMVSEENLTYAAEPFHINLIKRKCLKLIIKQNISVIISLLH